MIRKYTVRIMSRSIPAENITAEKKNTDAVGVVCNLGGVFQAGETNAAKWEEYGEWH